jgi:hypothetical protein
MKTQQNIGTINAILRMTLGLTFLCWATAKLVKKPWRQSYLIIVFLSAMKIAEGILKFCPVTELLKLCEEHNDFKQQNQSQIEEPTLPYSPL